MRIAFKEWAVIVDALGRGGQIVILRKGGLREGRDGFQVEHPEFLFFPTLFHQQREAVLPSAQIRFDEIAPHLPGANRLRVEFFARVIDFRRLDSLATAERLRGQHVCSEWSRARVNVDYHIVFDTNYYSVPYTLLHERVEARVSAGAVEIFRHSHRVASHPRLFGRGQDYVSLMTDLDGSRVLEVVPGRDEEAAGKLWKTLFPLLFRPGFLTRAYFAGRRRRYIGPARLFLAGGGPPGRP